jgi:hypothetical protein
VRIRDSLQFDNSQPGAQRDQQHTYRRAVTAPRRCKPVLDLIGDAPCCRCLCYMRTVAPKHSMRDPDLARPRNGTERDLAQVGFWPASERERMDQRFAAAMQAAGYGSTMPSTHFGTRNPVAGYRRD